MKLRKLIIDDMKENMMKHEVESAQLAENLSMIKTQILANEAGENVLGKTYRCQKVGTLKDVPCVVSNLFQGGLILLLTCSLR